MIRRMIGALLLLSAPSVSASTLEVSAPFTDLAVLQQGAPARFRGQARPGARVELEFRGARYLTWASPSSGEWSLTLPPLSPGASAGPAEDVLIRSGRSRIRLRDVRVGEVWLCSGQSNMEFPLWKAKGGSSEIARSANPGLRFLTLDKRHSDRPAGPSARALEKASWRASEPSSAGDFSAVCYFFGKELQARLGVTVGLIQSAWGGTPAEAWATRATLASDPELAPILSYREGAEIPKGHPEWAAQAIYNEMIHPLLGYAIRGVNWYQGETNAWRAKQYLRLLPALIEDWRRGWGVNGLPFQIVQLPGYGQPPALPGRSAWAELREAQALAALSVPNVGMVTTLDLGEPDDIHPERKREIGERLATLARKQVYGEKRLQATGPVLARAERDGKRVLLEFEAGSGPLHEIRGPSPCFAVAGADGIFHWADARITSSTQIVVTAPGVPDPRGVRYAWADNPDCVLVNLAGWVAGSFRSQVSP